MIKCYYTKELQLKYPDFKIGCAIIENTDTHDLDIVDYLKSRKEQIERDIKENLPLLLGKSEQMGKFFNMLNTPNYHIASLLQATAQGRPLKLVNPLVDIVQFAELSDSILMGLHDLDRVQGDIYADILESPEEMETLFGKHIILEKGNLVIRDKAKIFASLTKGPDKETKVTSDSRRIVILGFFYPAEALEKGMFVLNECCKEIADKTRARILTITEAETL